MVCDGFDLGDGVFYGDGDVGGLEHRDVVAVVAECHDAVGSYAFGQPLDAGSFTAPTCVYFKEAYSGVEDVVVEGGNAPLVAKQLVVNALERGIVVHREDEQCGVVAGVIVRCVENECLEWQRFAFVDEGLFLCR